VAISDARLPDSGSMSCGTIVRVVVTKRASSHSSKRFQFNDGERRRLIRVDLVESKQARSAPIAIRDQRGGSHATTPRTDKDSSSIPPTADGPSLPHTVALPLPLRIQPGGAIVRATGAWSSCPAQVGSVGVVRGDRLLAKDVHFWKCGPAALARPAPAARYGR